MPSPLVLVSALAFLVQAQAFFILNQSPLVRERLDPIVNPGGISTHVHNVVGGSRFGKDYSVRRSRSLALLLGRPLTPLCAPVSPPPARL